MCKPHLGKLQTKGAIDEGWNPSELTVRLGIIYVSIMGLHFLPINGDKIIITPYSGNHKNKNRFKHTTLTMPQVCQEFSECLL